MAKHRHIVHVESGATLVERAKWCDSFGTKLQGFMFKRTLKPTDGLVLVEKSDSRVSTSIHMLFVNFDLGVVWVNDAGEVVDTAVAKAWKPHYAPKAPARYVIEMHPSRLSQVQVGDHIEFRACG